jgi:hypothetical protein
MVISCFCDMGLGISDKGWGSKGIGGEQDAFCGNPGRHVVCRHKEKGEHCTSNDSEIGFQDGKLCGKKLDMEVMRRWIKVQLEELMGSCMIVGEATM